MKRWRSHLCAFTLPAVSVSAVLLLAGCGEKQTPVGKNLITNGSFEEVVDGVPVGWRLERFRGLDSDVSVEWGVDEDRAYDGRRSFYFAAGPYARRFFVLVQTIGLAVVARLTGNQRGRDDFAMEAVFGQNPMQDKAGTGSFITSPNSTSLG